MDHATCCGIEREKKRTPRQSTLISTCWFQAIGEQLIGHDATLGFLAEVVKEVDL